MSTMRLAVCAAAILGLVGTSIAQRPALAPGQSNATLKGADPGGLATTDLTTLTPADLVTALVGPGVSVSNINYQGVNVSAGTFSGGATAIGFASGIILSSGSINSVPGPNDLGNTTTNNGQPGDADLNTLIPGTQDRTVLEFDFTCSGTQTISFQYVFTSEEYNEYVDSQFNDVFGFFLGASGSRVGS